MQYKDFPKGDARRYLVALLAVDRLKDGATIHYVAQEIGSTRAEAQRALQVLSEQFGVVFAKNGSTYQIEDWGVFKRTAVASFLKSVN